MLFHALRTLCGLDVEAAAHHLGVPQRRIRRWDGPGRPDPNALTALVALHNQQVSAAFELLETYDAATGNKNIVIPLPANDAVAREIGWPSAGAAAMIAAIAQAEEPDAQVVIEPFGEEAVSYTSSEDEDGSDDADGVQDANDPDGDMEGAARR